MIRVLYSIHRLRKQARFVYRLGLRVFIPARAVRFRYRVPDLITLVTKPVGNLTSENQLTDWHF